ncbi:hypothetical protein [Polaromonas sp.]|uniref:hypothetical protein n=1 Tax=Polaromonas sp. TaxID=1869339 RepID=UPI003CBC3B28
MTDPRNIARDKKIQQKKKHYGEEIAPQHGTCRSTRQEAASPRHRQAGCRQRDG